MSETPLILWVRRDLRLGDQPMIAAAVASGRPVVPVFILDPETEALGAAPKWRLGLAVEAFAKALKGLGVRLVLRRGAALEVLRALVVETGAGGVWWSRLYDPASVARDTAVKAALKGEGVEARSFAGPIGRPRAGYRWRHPRRSRRRCGGWSAGRSRTGWRTGGWGRR